MTKRILIAADKFKGSLSADEVCKAIQRGILSVDSSFDISLHPMADGGDGSLDILKKYIDFKTISLQSFDPLSQEITVDYHISDHSAYIELANSTGLVLLEEEDRNPMLTSSYGTGVVIRDALERGVSEVFLFLGGSSTNDAGFGILHALGYKFLDTNGRMLFPCGENLIELYDIEYPQERYRNVKFTIICDVRNTLFGPEGAAFCYAKQKGASEDEIIELDEGLRHIADIIKDHCDLDIASMEGGGAAGGIGCGLVAFLPDAKLVKGFKLISNFTDLEDAILKSDIVITGEGSLDDTSFNGKVVSGILDLCNRHRKELYLFCGINSIDAKHNEIDKNHIYPIRSIANDLQDSISNASSYLEVLAKELARSMFP